MTETLTFQKYQNVFRLTCCTLGICCSYWFYGFLQENLLTHSNLGATFILVFQTLTNVLVALFWRHVEETSFLGMTNNNNINNKQTTTATTTTSLSSYLSSLMSLKDDLNQPLLALISATYVFAMAASNEALQFVSYPTAVLAKSCKMIPIMVMGSLVERRQYSPKQWLSAFCISFGIAAFNLSRITKNDSNNDSNNSHNHNHNHNNHDQSDEYWKGMALLFISLCMDGFLGSLQGLLKRKNDDDNKKQFRPPTAVETMLFINFYALLLLIPMSMIAGQWNEGIQLLFYNNNNNQQHQHLLTAVLVLNGVVSIGQIFIFLTITWYSSLVCTTITTTRKFFTILFSVIYFGHAFSTMQWISVCLVFAGLYLSIAASSSPSPSSSKDQNKQNSSDNHQKQQSHNEGSPSMAVDDTKSSGDKKDQ